MRKRNERKRRIVGDNQMHWFPGSVTLALELFLGASAL